MNGTRPCYQLIMNKSPSSNAQDPVKIRHPGIIDPSALYDFHGQSSDFLCFNLQYSGSSLLPSFALQISPNFSNFQAKLHCLGISQASFPSAKHLASCRREFTARTLFFILIHPVLVEDVLAILLVFARRAPENGGVLRLRPSRRLVLPAGGEVGLGRDVTGSTYSGLGYSCLGSNGLIVNVHLQRRLEAMMDNTMCAV
jgi:hypothetical protein